MGDDKGKEIRWTERDLRRILGTLFTKCDVMSGAIAKAAGVFDVEPNTLGSFPPAAVDEDK